MRDSQHNFFHAAASKCATPEPTLFQQTVPNVRFKSPYSILIGKRSLWSRVQKARAQYVHVFSSKFTLNVAQHCINNSIWTHFDEQYSECEYFFLTTKFLMAVILYTCIIVIVCVANFVAAFSPNFTCLWSPYVIGQTIYIFILSFVLSFFFLLFFLA